MARTSQAGSSPPSLGMLHTHDGPWTESDYLGLPAHSGRIELVDGSLLVSPADDRGIGIASRVRDALERAVPDTLTVVGSVQLRVAPGRIVRPDLVVCRPHAADVDVVDAADVLLVVDVASRGALVDQIVMPQLYADAGIPYYLRIDRHTPAALAHMLIAGRHREFAAAGPGQTLTLEDPFPLALDLDALLGSSEG